LLDLHDIWRDGKENEESTGRFVTGFLTTHCLWKKVKIKGDVFQTEERTIMEGFSVTMIREGSTYEE
jgi:hypothetical protein